MKITDVIIRKLYTGGKMRAIVSVTFDNVFVIHDIKVIHGQNGLFIAMPSRRMMDGTYKDICHPIDAQTRFDLQNEILAAYDKALAESELQDSGENSFSQQGEALDPADPFLK